METNHLIAGLRSDGVRITPQRIAICRWLEGNTSHPSAANIYDALSVDFPTMSQATVYNTLRLLESRDLIHEVTRTADGHTRYDPDTENHLNLVCSQCSKIIDLPAINLEIVQQAAQAEGFLMDDVNLVVHGICKSCQENNKETA